MIRLFFTAALVSLACIANPAAAKELKSIGVTVGSLGNPFFVAIVRGVESQAKLLNPHVKVTALSADYDLNKQFNQIDSFISARVDMIVINAADPKAIEPAVRRAQKAGIVVIAVDVSAAGADATVQTDNVKAGAMACQHIVEKLQGKGNVIIENGPQVSAVIDRVNGCKSVLSKQPGIKVLSDDQDGKGSRDGGLSVMQGLLVRFPKIDGVFATNDPQAIGSDLAARQFKRTGIVITSVDGAPDIEVALKNKNSLISASASQNPWAMARQAVELGAGIVGGKRPEQPVLLIPPTLVTRDDVATYRGWATPQ